MRPILKLPSYKLGTDQSLQLGVEFLTREKIHLPVVNCDWSLMQEKVVDIVDSFVVCVIATCVNLLIRIGPDRAYPLHFTPSQLLLLLQLLQFKFMEDKNDWRMG